MNVPPTVPYAELPPERIGIRPPRFQLPDKARLGLVSLQIADLERSLEFYQRVIGFTVLSRDDTPGARVARLGIEGRTALLELREKRGVNPAKHRGRLGLYHLALLLPSRGDLGRFLAHALGTGAHVGQSDHLYSEATYLVDPDGISLEVYADRPRSTWRVTPQGELIGGLDPLDTEALKIAAGDLSWTGLPLGTTVGHLHFYVGDLEEAARFYHAGLGFAKMSWNFPSALFLGVNGYHHQIGVNTWAAGSLPSSDDDARLLNWELILPDQQSLRDLQANLEATGFSLEVAECDFTAQDAWGIRVHVLSA